MEWGWNIISEIKTWPFFWLLDINENSNQSTNLNICRILTTNKNEIKWFCILIEFYNVFYSILHEVGLRRIFKSETVLKLSQIQRTTQSEYIHTLTDSDKRVKLVQHTFNWEPKLAGYIRFHPSHVHYFVVMKHVSLVFLLDGTVSVFKINMCQSIGLLEWCARMRANQHIAIEKLSVLK